MAFWDIIKKRFQIKESHDIDKDFKENLLTYSGKEKNCWACERPIHRSHKRSRIKNKILHKKCFKEMKKIAVTGGIED